MAALKRHRAADDPELLSASVQLREEVLVRAVEKALEKSPPLTEAVRQRIVGLLAVAQ
ncbi:hypothetical protein [Mycobacterium sp. JS623]|uniref:hypothetical protein n=1 Tax=Mycobacterium sp. JS623 TaxID=212767 RepID=UPI00031EBDA0|nr:hypothetical protein [Mycobacterium sp. JS623]